MLAAGTVTIAFKNQATMLCRPKGRYERELQEGATARAFPEQVGLINALPV